jgi:hypothetical protein
VKFSSPRRWSDVVGEEFEDVAGRRFFTDTTEHWKRRASLRGPSVHHSEAERFIRKATELLGHRASALPHIRYINPFRQRQFSSVPEMGQLA